MRGFRRHARDTRGWIPPARYVTGERFVRKVKGTRVTARKVIGVLGGVGREAPANLCLNILRYSQDQCDAVEDSDYPPVTGTSPSRGCRSRLDQNVTPSVAAPPTSLSLPATATSMRTTRNGDRPIPMEAISRLSPAVLTR